MSSEVNWRFSELGKEAINASRPFSFKTHPQVVFVNTGDVLDGKFLHSDITEGKGLPGQAKKALRKDDILLTEIRPGNGRFAYVDFDPAKYVVSTKFMVIESLGRVSPRFLYHVLTNQNSLDAFQRIAESRSGTFPQITFDSIAHFPIPIPSPSEQAALVAFWDSIQRRIDLLRETNATLEAIAQALFKSWFVDFDAVHAKQKGRAPEGLDEATAALFPDSFEESELGLVPRDWKVCSFTDTIKVIGGGTPKTSITDYWNGSIPWFSVVDAPARSDVFVIDTEKHITDVGLKNSSTRLLPAGTTIISARGTVGKLALCGREMAMNQSCYGLLGTSGDAYYTYFSTHRLVETLKQRSHGSVFDTITNATLAGVLVTYPTVQIVTSFENLLSPVMERIKENLKQAVTLTTLRDTLLPRLISGQLRLPEAEALAA
jgi:restriction endonuclease S subunit